MPSCALDIFRHPCKSQHEVAYVFGLPFNARNIIQLEHYLLLGNAKITKDNRQQVDLDMLRITLHKITKKIKGKGKLCKFPQI